MSEAQNTVALPPHPEIEKADALYGVSRWGAGLSAFWKMGISVWCIPTAPMQCPLTSCILSTV